MGVPGVSSVVVPEDVSSVIFCFSPVVLMLPMSFPMSHVLLLVLNWPFMLQAPMAMFLLLMLFWPLLILMWQLLLGFLILLCLLWSLLLLSLLLLSRMMCSAVALQFAASWGVCAIVSAVGTCDVVSKKAVFSVVVAAAPAVS